MPLRAALGAGAVVAVHEDDHRVVELARFFDGLDQSADLVVGHLDEGGEHLDLAGEQALLVGRQRVPVRNRLGLGRELRALGDDAELDLPRQDLLAQLVPALVELALPAGDPFLGHMVRRVDWRPARSR